MSVSPGRVAVVVLNWNGRELLAPCIDSVLASRDVELDLIVVDNGSSDGSVEYLKSLGDAIHLVENDRNLRFAAGNNRGVQKASELGAQLVLILNNDATVDPECVKQLVTAFEVDAQLGVAGGQICYADRPQKIWYGGGNATMALGWFRHRGIRREIEADVDPSGPTDWVTGCAMMVRTELWESLGGLDDSYYIYAEDLDFCLRARDLGAKIGYVREARIAHAVSSTVGGIRSPFKVYHQSRARMRLLCQHARPWHWPSLVFAVLAQDILLASLLLLRGQLPSLLALGQAWGDLGRARVRYEP